ncbi:uncharacterized protein LOC135837311 [Planococcus citri]|uniref:uncharacterized protein LOC135837311 n=1 Tax=Planococcus citri TaxID=170843 RepID=UPI0031F9007A
MCSYGTMKILFFILLQLTGVYSTHKVSLENDITSHIDNWVTSIFTFGGKNGAEAVSKIYGSELNEFEYNIGNQENNSHAKYIFQNIRFRAPYGTEGAVVVQQINWKLSESKISTFFDQLRFLIDVEVKTGIGNYEKKISMYARFKNLTLTALGSYTKDDYLKITHDFTCNAVEYWTESDYLQGNLTYEDKKQIHREIKPILPTILRKSLNTSQKSIQKIDDLFQEYEKPRQEIISVHPDFMSNPLKYYYLIPKIPFFCFILKRIVIHGLSNFESYQAQTSFRLFTHTLLIRNIQGSMTLDYRSEKEKSLKLNFQIDCFILSKKDGSDCIYAQAKYYTITRRKTNTTLSGRQSGVIINRLESVLASRLLGLPSKKIEQICDVEMPVEKIEISNCSDWKTIKESYKEWIPFNDDKEIKK